MIGFKCKKTKKTSRLSVVELWLLGSSSSSSGSSRRLIGILTWSSSSATDVLYIWKRCEVMHKKIFFFSFFPSCEITRKKKKKPETMENSVENGNNETNNKREQKRRRRRRRRKQNLTWANENQVETLKCYWTFELFFRH